MKIFIIGSGIGGMSCAATLAYNGFDVTIIEQNDYFGGKANRISEKGFQFDTGPCLLTYPDWFEELFSSCGKNIKDYFQYQRLDPITRYFLDNKYVDVASDINQTAINFEKKLGLKKVVFLNYIERWIRIYKISEKIFLLNELKFSFFFLKNALDWIFKAGVINIFNSMAHYNKALKNKSVEKIMNRFATYTGSSPYKTPAFMNQIAIVEMINGGYYPNDGIHSISKALYRLCKDVGVEFQFNTKIDSIIYKNNLFKFYSNGKVFTSNYLISNIDYYKTQILLNRKFKRKFLRLSTSAIVFYWGVKIKSSKLKLHNIIFSEDYKKEFSQIFDTNKIPNDPTIYINITSKFDKNHAPENCENWFVMVNTPPSLDIVNEENINKTKKFIISKIYEKVGIDLEDSIIFEKILTPKTLENKTGSFNGSLYGDNQNSLMSIIKRKKNKDYQLKKMYYVGGTVHPGGGMPLALRSGINVAKSIINEIE
jgi:phytoene desaturase